MKRFPAIIFLILIVGLTAACQARLGIQDLTTLSPESRQQLSETPIFRTGELDEADYQVLAPVVGYSCRHFNYEPDAKESDAREQFKLKAMQAGGNAAILESCVHEGTS